MPEDCTANDSDMPAAPNARGATYAMRSTRARISNHQDLLPGITDGRSPGARRFRDLVNAYIADAGGIENCSAVRLGLLRRLASITVLCEALEVKVVNGNGSDADVDIGEMCNLASTVVRLSQRLGINRTPRNITPTLAEYLQQVAE
jgi:hypothetical protein